MKDISYGNFWKKTYFLAKRRGILLRAMFELTYRCNFKCRHCYIPESYKKHGELKTKEIFSILKQLKDMGCLYLGFTGGEPLMRKDIFDILWYAKKKGFLIILNTNGSMIDEKAASEFKKIGLNKIDITIPAFSEEAFDAIVGVKGYKDKVFNAIEILLSKKVNLGFKTCLLKENEREIQDIKDYSSFRWTLHRLDMILFPRLDGDQSPFRYRGKAFLKNKPKDKSFLKKEPDFCGYLDSKGDDVKLFKCGAGSAHVDITPLGELKLCTVIDWPKLKISSIKGGLEDAWGKLEKMVNNINIDKDYKCNNCELAIYCKWCPAMAWLYNKSFTSCEPNMKRFAKMLKEYYE